MDKITRTKHTTNHSSFAKQTEERDYWAGFLFADATISKKVGNSSRVLTLTLAKKDIEQLHKFKTFLQSTVPVVAFTSFNKGTQKEYQLCRFAVVSEEICTTLEVLGMRGLRSMPSPELLGSKHFWRGVLDGDGSLRYHAPKGKAVTPSYCLSLVGGEEIVGQFQKYIKKIVPRFAGNVLKCGGTEATKQVVTSHNIAKELTVHLYKDNIISLDRKNIIAQNIIEELLNE